MQEVLADPISQTAMLRFDPVPVGSDRAYAKWIQLLILAGTSLVFVASTLSLLIFAYSFYVLIETVSLLLAGAPSVVAGVLSLSLGTACSGTILYLGFDHALLICNRKLQRRLWDRSMRVIGGPVPTDRAFVEIRSTSNQLQIGADVGWIFVLSDRLVFVGESGTLELPRGAITAVSQPSKPFGDLTAPWLTIRLMQPWGTIRVINRTDVTRLSQTAYGTKQLAQTLSAWLTE